MANNYKCSKSYKFMDDWSLKDILIGSTRSKNIDSFSGQKKKVLTNFYNKSQVTMYIIS